MKSIINKSKSFIATIRKNHQQKNKIRKENVYSKFML